MNLHLLACVCGLLALLLGASSCVSRPAGSPGVSVTRSTQPASADAVADPETDMKSPWMFREAQVPAGFPPPGPIGQVILKEYPAYRAARVTSPADARDASGAMFRRLFQHIKKNDIAMTAPVEMTYPDTAASRQDQPIAMAFLYGDPQAGKAGPDGGAEVVDLPRQKVLSVTVRGGYESSFEKGIAQLRQWSIANPGQFEVIGPPRFLGYNSPFVPPFLRIGEVQIPVTSATGTGTVLGLSPAR